MATLCAVVSPRGYATDANVDMEVSGSADEQRQPLSPPAATAATTVPVGPAASGALTPAAMPPRPLPDDVATGLELLLGFCSASPAQNVPVRVAKLSGRGRPRSSGSSGNRKAGGGVDGGLSVSRAAGSASASAMPAPLGFVTAIRPVAGRPLVAQGDKRARSSVTDAGAGETTLGVAEKRLCVANACGDETGRDAAGGQGVVRDDRSEPAAAASQSPLQRVVHACEVAREDKTPTPPHCDADTAVQTETAEVALGDATRVAVTPPPPPPALATASLNDDRTAASSSMVVHVPLSTAVGCDGGLQPSTAGTDAPDSTGALPALGVSSGEARVITGTPPAAVDGTVEDGVAPLGFQRVISGANLIYRCSTCGYCTKSSHNASTCALGDVFFLLPEKLVR